MDGLNYFSQMGYEREIQDHILEVIFCIIRWFSVVPVIQGGEKRKRP